MESKYLKFVLYEEREKTKVFHVKSKISEAVLGEIKWYGPWRQYCFYPSSDCVFNDGCLQDICRFMNLEMQKRWIRREKSDG